MQICDFHWQNIQLSKYNIGENDRIKYVDYLKSSNPFGVKCGPEEKCLVCKNPKAGPICKVANVGYSLECLLCKERNSTMSYHGETARNGYLRGTEHQSEFERKSKNSVMYKHVMHSHKDEQSDVQFDMKIVGKFNNCLSRQIDESIRIRNQDPATLLNSKSEFYGPVIKRKVYEN